MIDALRPALLCTLPCVLALGCFEDPNAVNETDSSDDEVGQTESESETDSETSTGTETAETETAETETAETETAETGELGPQIIESVPTNGDIQAGINGYFFLTFDRPVSSADATGKILASQGDSDPVAVVIMPCPSLDPACLVGLYPESFGDQNSLPGDTDHQIIVSAAFPDPDGLTNETDQIVDFRTFFYEESWYDDNAALDELWGIAYDPVSESLYLSGEGDENQDGPVIRRVPLPNGSPQPATTAATPTAGFGGPSSYGLDRYGNNLLVSMSYPSAVARYQINAGGNLNLQEIIDTPPLPPPTTASTRSSRPHVRSTGACFSGLGTSSADPTARASFSAIRGTTGRSGKRAPASGIKTRSA